MRFIYKWKNGGINTTVINEVTNISLDGGPYTVGDVLSVDQGDVGGSGSGFQYTVTKVGFIKDVTISDGGFGYNVGQTLIPRVSGNESGPSTSGNPFQLTVGAVTSADRFEFTHDGAIKSDSFKIAGTKDPTLYEGSLSIGKSATVFQVEGENGHITTSGNITADGNLVVKGNLTFGDESTDTITVTGTQTVTGDSTQTGNFSLEGDLTQTVGNVTLTNTTASLADGTAAAPSLNFVTSATTGLFHKNPDEFGIAIAGVEKAVYGTSFNIGNDFQVGDTTTTASPVLRVDVANATVITGTSAKGLQINNDASIEAIGTDADVDLLFKPKGNGGISFQGALDRNFLIKYGPLNVLDVDMATGDLEAMGYVQTNERLRITDSEISNVAQGVVNSFGEVVGINTAIIAPGQNGSVGIGFAIPSNAASNVIDQLIKYGETKRGWIGVRIQEVSKEIAEIEKLDKPQGALIASVSEGGPADKAGLQAGDIILEFDGKKVDSMRTLPKLVASTEVGKKVPLKIWRNKKSIDKTIILGRLESSQDFKDETGKTLRTNADDFDVEKLKISVRTIDDNDIESKELDKKTQGVVITGISPDSVLAGKANVGDVIVEVQKKKVSSPEQFNKIIADAKSGENLLLVLVNTNQRRYLGIKLD